MKLKRWYISRVYLFVIVMPGMSWGLTATSSSGAIITASYMPPEELLKETVALVIENPGIQDKAEYLYLIHIQNAKDFVVQGKPKAAKVELENFIRFVIQEWVDGAMNQTLSQVLISLAEETITKLNH